MTCEFCFLLSSLLILKFFSSQAFHSQNSFILPFFFCIPKLLILQYFSLFAESRLEKTKRYIPNGKRALKITCQLIPLLLVAAPFPSWQQLGTQGWMAVEMCNVSSGFCSVKWWQSEKENTGCNWREEDVSSAPLWEPSTAPVLTSASLVQVQRSNQGTKNTMRQPFPATSWPHPFSNQTLLFFQWWGGKKSPVAFDQTRKEEKQIECSSCYLWVPVWAGLSRAVPQLLAAVGREQQQHNGLRNALPGSGRSSQTRVISPFLLGRHHMRSWMWIYNI